MIESTRNLVSPEKMDPMSSSLLEHIARYHFALPYVKGRVLDLTCGSGYSSKLMAKACKKKITQIIGVDNNKEAIIYAQKASFHPLLTFLHGDVIDNNFISTTGKFDTIVCFETIEHVDNYLGFMEQMYKLLKPEGTLILSTPLLTGQKVPLSTSFHSHQLSVEEFKKLLYRFPNTEYYFQRGVMFVPICNNNRSPIGIGIAQK